MARTRKHKTNGYESTGTYIDARGKARPDTAAMIFESMLISPAFTSLKPRQKILYVYCKAQLFGKHKPRQDYDQQLYPEVQTDECFYFNFALAVGYGLYTSTGRKEFYSDMQALCDRGLIERVISGRATKQKNVYRLSAKWQLWTDTS